MMILLGFCYMCSNITEQVTKSLSFPRRELSNLFEEQDHHYTIKSFSRIRTEKKVHAIY